MGDIPKPILRLVACALVLAALVGFTLGFTQTDRKSFAGEEAPIASNLPANVVIKDAVPLAAPSPPPPPKAKAPEADEAASDQPASDRAPAPPVEAPPPGPPPSLPGGPLPADLPPT